jgi:hypothetical protein
MWSPWDERNDNPYYITTSTEPYDRYLLLSEVRKIYSLESQLLFSDCEAIYKEITLEDRLQFPSSYLEGWVSFARRILRVCLSDAKEPPLNNRDIRDFFSPVRTPERPTF